MEATAESGASDDWLTGAMVEAGGECGPEHVEVALEGLEFGTDNVA
jgi:hypothetical protein